MALHRSNHGRKYNDKECWDKFMEMGDAATVTRINNWHKEKYGFVSRMGVVWAMWRYACQNPHEAYEQYKKWYFETATAESSKDPTVTDSNITFEQFLKLCQKQAKGNGSVQRNSILSRRAYRKWCQKWNLEE